MKYSETSVMAVNFDLETRLHHEWFQCDRCDATFFIHINWIPGVDSLKFGLTFMFIVQAGEQLSRH